MFKTNKRAAKLFLLSVTVVYALIACSISSRAPSFSTASTNEALYTAVAQGVFMTLAAQSNNIDLELTRIFTEIETSPVSTPSTNSRNWLDIWLSSPTCQPPCWENITPSQTTLNDAMKIIAQIPGAKFEWLYLTPQVIDKTTFVRWKFDASNWGQVATGANSQIVSSIELFPSNEQKLTIKELIDVYGNPSSIVRGACFGEYFYPIRCGYVLLYKEMGMVLYIDISSRKDKPVDITSDIHITGITLSLPEDVKVFDVDYQSNDEIEWDGFKIYNFPNE